ncbi:MAG: S8/S53 family peptidase, partial [Candidatus Aminicenantes bacterium]|nr:S8/S53 family peptidase [Candidatus Aminicenantes bacterium]
PLRKAVEYCRQNNVIVISPIGNLQSEPPGETVYYPAAYSSTIAVGGVEKNDTGFRVWEKSDLGSYIDIVAPAEGFLTETPSYLDTRTTPRYLNGNSLAASIVAGTAALILSALDESVKEAFKQVPGKLPRLIKSILQQSASNELLGFASFNDFTGHGLINAKKAVELARLQSSPLKKQQSY